MEARVNSECYQNGGVTVPRFTAHEQRTQRYRQNELLSQRDCTDTIGAGRDLHPRVIFRVLQEENKKFGRRPLLTSAYQGKQSPGCINTYTCA